jgi:hypothetical protein
MSATELLEKIKALPPSEQAAFAGLFQSWKAGGNGAAPTAPQRPVQLPDYAARLRRLFPDGPISGDPQAFWDELRAERF